MIYSSVHARVGDVAVEGGDGTEEVGIGLRIAIKIFLCG